MKRDPGACLICQKPLQYFNTSKKLECSICHNEFESYASCTDGHFVCDSCHSSMGISVSLDFCKKTDLKDPIRIMQNIMEDPFIYMHGPEHHVMVGAAIITAYKNCGGDIDLESALDEMSLRGRNYPGGSCGFWGCCGAAVSVGMAVSIITNATPLTTKTWGLANEATSKALGAIAELGGPRCCKRNSFTAVLKAADFIGEHFNVHLDIKSPVICDFFHENTECKRKACPYYNKLLLK